VSGKREKKIRKIARVAAKEAAKGEAKTYLKAALKSKRFFHRVKIAWRMVTCKI